MSRIAVEGLERLLQAGLEAGKGRLAAGDEEYAERFFVLGRAYDPAHRSRFAPWLGALAGLWMIDRYLAQSDCQAAIRTAESLWETHQHRQALQGALLKRLEKVHRQASGNVKEVLDNLAARSDYLALLDAEVQQSVSVQVEELQQEASRQQVEERQKTQQQINRFTQRHRAWQRYELPKLIEAFEEGERLSGQARTVGVAGADLERRLGQMRQRRDWLHHQMIEAWQLVEKKRFEQALRRLEALGRAGITIVVGPNGEQEHVGVFMAKVLDEGDSHCEVQLRSELKNAAALFDPRDGVKHLQDVLRNLPVDYAKSRRTAKEAIQTLQRRVAPWVDAERRIQLALSRYEPADQLVRLKRIKEIYPDHPYLDEEIVRIAHQKEALELAQQAKDCIEDGRSSLRMHAVSEAEVRCNEAMERLQEAMELAPELVEQRFSYLSRRIERLTSDVEDAKRQSAHLASRVQEGG
ncbi:MAG: hypothetical protein H8D43_02360 [Chloroflexi bacterium]|nr:hypothetical protein [Chloroflexota bacterium]